MVEVLMVMVGQVLMVMVGQVLMVMVGQVLMVMVGQVLMGRVGQVLMGRVGLVLMVQEVVAEEVVSLCPVLDSTLLSGDGIQTSSGRKVGTGQTSAGGLMAAPDVPTSGMPRGETW